MLTNIKHILLNILSYIVTSCNIILQTYFIIVVNLLALPIIMYTIHFNLYIVSIFNAFDNIKKLLIGIEA